MQMTKKQLGAFLLFSIALWHLPSCYSPSHSQEYFIEATRDDPALEPIYATSIYTVYYDHALVRCVVHAAHTWGQNGGGGGGTGIGVYAFRCDPNRIRERARRVGITTYPPKIRHASRPVKQQQRTAITPRQRGESTDPANPTVTPTVVSPEQQTPQPVIRGVE